MIPLYKPYFNEKELDAVRQVFESGWVAGQGPQNQRLSEKVKKLQSCKYAISVNNCTAGLHLALLALKIKKGDEVLVSDFTFPATGHAVMYCGATPRFVDVDPRSYNMDPQAIEKKITPRTKAIIVVHAFGQVADMDPILKIAKKHNLKVIEDAACSMGARYKGKLAGSFGDITTFSFHARKNATAGEGGIIVTNDKEYAEFMKSLVFFGVESAHFRQTNFSIPKFDRLGYNYKLSDINAAIVIEQLRKSSRILKRKRKLVQLYNTILKNNALLTIPNEEADSLHVYQSYVVLLNKKINRNRLIMSLKKDGIQTQIGTYASHIQPIYQSTDTCLNSLFLYKQTLALPLYYELKEKEAKFVVKRLEYQMQRQLNLHGILKK